MNACADLDGLADGIATSIDARFAFDGDLLGCCDVRLHEGSYVGV